MTRAMAHCSDGGGIAEEPSTGLPAAQEHERTEQRDYNHAHRGMSSDQVLVSRVVARFERDQSVVVVVSLPVGRFKQHVEVVDALLALGKLCFYHDERSQRPIKPIPHSAHRSIHSFPESPLLARLGGDEVNETGLFILRRRRRSGRARATTDLTIEPGVKAVASRVGHAGVIGTEPDATERTRNRAQA